MGGPPGPVDENRRKFYNLCTIVPGGECVDRGTRSCIFCYAYRPGAWADGGFSVNVFGDDRLSVSTFSSQRLPLQQYYFLLPAGTSQRVLTLIRNADPWLTGFPVRMSKLPQPRQVSIVGLDCYPLFQLEDFDLLLDCPFLSKRGHNARLMYNLLEDISAVLETCGFHLSLDSFLWDASDPVVHQVEKFGTEPEKKTWLQRLFG